MAKVDNGKAQPKGMMEKLSRRQVNKSSINFLSSGKALPRVTQRSKLATLKINIHQIKVVEEFSKQLHSDRFKLSRAILFRKGNQFIKISDTTPRDIMHRFQRSNFRP